MKFKKNIGSVIERNRKLWNSDFKKGVLVKIDIDDFSTLRLWEEVLSPEYCPDYKKMFDVFLKYFKKREYLLDDATPTARPNIGDFAFGAYLGAEIVFSPVGGYSKPLISDLKDINSLEYNENNCWLKWLLEATKYFSEKSEGLFATSIIETMDGLNFAENIFGSKIYMEIIDNPDSLSAIFDFALEFNIKMIEGQRKFIKKHENGYFDIHEEWLPGNCVWLSIDSWGNCSRESFRKYGRHHLQEIINYFGCGWLHMHNSHLHLLEDVIELKNIVGIGILDDPKNIGCFKRLGIIREGAKEMPLQISCNKQEFLDELKQNTLPRNTMYWIEKGVKTVEEANKIVELVYEY